MPLTILTQEQVRTLLLSLTRDDVISLQRNLADALREYSTGNQDQGCSASYQPQRTAITRRDGNTTLFMPASTGKTIGMKIVSLQGDTTSSRPGCAVGNKDYHNERHAAKVSLPPDEYASRRSSGSVSTDMNALSLSSEEPPSPVSSSFSSQTPSINQQTIPTSSRPSSSSGPPLSSKISVGSVSARDHGGAWPAAGARDTSPRGAIALLGSDGILFGLVSAQELTAFRTALSALMIFNKRKYVRTVTVFGAGRQAYWHIRLALLLRGIEIKHVYIINRSFERAAELLQDIYAPENASWRADVKFSAVSSDFVEYPRLLKEAVRKADAIFCCTPSIDPLFPAEYLTSSEGKRKGRLISAIGSYRPHMAELHPDILKNEVKPHHRTRHHHKHAERGGVIIVDSLESCLQEAGEIIQAEVKPHQLVEIGELMIVKEAARLAIEDGGEGEKGLQRWLEKGNVIYKSVGLGLMDLVTGGDVVRLARERGVGTNIDDF